MQSKLLDIRTYQFAHLSAQELAQAAGASRSQILYWERAGFLQRNENSGHRMFALSEVPKATLMNTLTGEKVGLEGSSASNLADLLLKHVEKRPDAVEAVLGMLCSLHTNFDQVMDLLVGSEFKQHQHEVNTTEGGCEIGGPS